MSRTPKVSVCIPTYNYGRYLSFALDSIIAQSFQDWEIVISDNCSTDDTRAVVQRYKDRLGPKLRYHCNETNVGPLKNFNRSRELGCGEYLLFLCADDCLDPGALASMVQALDRHPTAAMASAYLSQEMDEEGRLTGPVVRKPLGTGLVPGREVVRAQCRFSGVVGCPSMVLVRAGSLPSGDMYDARFEQNSDNALWCLLAEKWDVVYVEDALVYIRAHGQSGTERYMKSAKDIQCRAALFHWLFRESPALRGQWWLRQVFIRCRLYPWFERSLQAARQGDWQKSLWILRNIAAFSWIPWWLPFFLLIKLRYLFYASLRPLKRKLFRPSVQGG